MSTAPAFEISASRQFTNWMLEQKLSLSFTTYQAGQNMLPPSVSLMLRMAGAIGDRTAAA